MSLDERVTTLEQEMTTMKREYFVQLGSINQGMAKLNNTMSTVFLRQHETNENVTMNLGMLTSQNDDIKVLKNRMERVDARFDDVDRNLAEARLHLIKVDERLDKMDQRFDAIDQRFDTLTEQVGTILTILTNGHRGGSPPQA